MGDVLFAGFSILFLGLFVSLKFSFATVRTLRENSHRSHAFEAQDLFSGADVAAIAASASIPKWWRDYRAKQEHTMLQEKHKWIMQNTKLWERIAARIFIALLWTGMLLIMIAIVSKDIFEYAY